jgi:hypothetical protein
MHVAPEPVRLARIRHRYTTSDRIMPKETSCRRDRRSSETSSAAWGERTMSTHTSPRAPGWHNSPKKGTELGRRDREHGSDLADDGHGGPAARLVDPGVHQRSQVRGARPVIEQRRVPVLDFPHERLTLLS